MRELLSSIGYGSIGGAGIVLMLRVAPRLENGYLEFVTALLGFAGIVFAAKGLFFSKNKP